MPLIACLTASLLACYSGDTDPARGRLHAPTPPSRLEFYPQYDHDLFERRAILMDPAAERFAAEPSAVRHAAIVYSDVLAELETLESEEARRKDKRAKNRKTEGDEPEKPVKVIAAVPMPESVYVEPDAKKGWLASLLTEDEADAPQASKSKPVDDSGKAVKKTTKRTKIVIERGAGLAYAEPETKQNWLASLFNNEFQTTVPKVKGIDMNKEGYREVVKAAREHGVPVDLALRVAKQESGGNCSVTSHAGAGGVMQVMPKTAAKHGVTRFKNIYDCRTGAQTGVRELKHLLKLSNGDIKQTLIGYNCGERCMNGKRKKLPAETVNYVAVIAGK